MIRWHPVRVLLAGLGVVFFLRFDAAYADDWRRLTADEMQSVLPGYAWQDSGGISIEIWPDGTQVTLRDNAAISESSWVILGDEYCTYIDAEPVCYVVLARDQILRFRLRDDPWFEYRRGYSLREGREYGRELEGADIDALLRGAVLFNLSLTRPIAELNADGTYILTGDAGQRDVHRWAVYDNQLCITDNSCVAVSQRQLARTVTCHGAHCDQRPISRTLVTLHGKHEPARWQVMPWYFAPDNDSWQSLSRPVMVRILAIRDLVNEEGGRLTLQHNGILVSHSSDGARAEWQFEDDALCRMTDPAKVCFRIIAAGDEVKFQYRDAKTINEIRWHIVEKYTSRSLSE